METVDQDAKRLFQQKRAGYASEIRKQTKKKKEIEMMNKTANRITMIKPTSKGKNVLGIQGAKAALAKTLNFGVLARS